MITAIVMIIDDETKEFISDPFIVMPHIETYKIRKGSKIRKSKFSFSYEMKVEEDDD